MPIVTLLKADVTACRRCHERGCGHCNGKGYFVHDESYQITLPDPPAPVRDRSKTFAQYWQRRADLQCTVCGSPDLASETLCAACLEKTNARSVESNRRTRDTPRDIG